MSQRADTFDLARLSMTSGEGRRVTDLEVPLDDLELWGDRFATPDAVPVILDVSRMTGGGYALRLRFSATLDGQCMRCLGVANPVLDVDSREIHEHDAGGDPELTSPYVDGEDVLNLTAWARDALALELPRQVVCKPECAGLCAECGADLNLAGPEHAHEREPDPRWAALRDLNLN